MLVAKLCSFFPNFTPFLKIMLFEKIANKSKTKKIQFLLVLAFSESPASFWHDMDQAWPTPFCNL